MYTSSPHTWGCFFAPVEIAPTDVVFPTHVGVFLKPKRASADSSSLPHTRGGVSFSRAEFECHCGSSPHTWGCFFTHWSNSVPDKVFPTHVGVFLNSATLAGDELSLPHTRGGVSFATAFGLIAQPSSPHTWGCFRLATAQADLNAVFPTHVGVFPGLVKSHLRAARLPHTRGGVSKGH